MKQSNIIREFRQLGILFLIFFVHHLFGQVSSSVHISIDSVGLGDPVTLDLKIIIPQGIDIKGLDLSSFRKIENQNYPQDSISFERYADLEVLDFGSWKHESINIPIPSEILKITEENGQKIIKNTIKIAIYNAGVFAIPATKVITGDTTIQSIQGQSAMIWVSLPEKLLAQDTVLFNPIKDIMREDADFSDYLIYLYIFVACLLMAAVGYYFYKLKQRKAKTIPETIEIFVPCHERALAALRQLEAMELWQKGMIKEYQSGLTDIVRKYLLERYYINAPEMTTDEIVTNLIKADFDKKYSYELVNILQIADLVKFAKARPDENIHSTFMTMAVDFIENTKEAKKVVKEL